jgi:hypothetical protein
VPIDGAMDFNATSTNITELLVVVLVVVSAILLMRKRYESNSPLLSYVAVIGFTNAVEGRTLDPFLLYGGLALALLIRFEFMGTGFAKVIGYMAAGSLGAIIFVMMSQVLYS